MILELKRQGLGVSAIARQTGLDRKTVRKYLERGLEAPVYGPREPKERLAEEYCTYLVDKLAAWPGLSARRLHREIKAMGFEGAYSTLTEYLRLIRPAAPRQFERRFETPAGQQAQVDFAEFQVAFTSEPGVTRKVWLFSMVLGHSRWLWGRFCPNQTLETVMRSHIAAFDAMGGACAEVLYDRMKTAVIGEDGAGVVTYNASLVVMLAHYGSAPRACQPYRAKGKVERPLRYVRQDFFLGRSFRDIDDLNAQFAEWRTTIANPRVHATTQRVVDEHFAEEQPHLVALPARPYDAVPTVERRIVEVQNHPTEVRIFEDGELIACHPVLEGKNQKRVDPSHRKPVPVARRATIEWLNPVDTPVQLRPLAFYEAIGQRLAGQPEGRP